MSPQSMPKGGGGASDGHSVASQYQWCFGHAGSQNQNQCLSVTKTTRDFGDDNNGTSTSSVRGGGSVTLPPITPGVTTTTTRHHHQHNHPPLPSSQTASGTTGRPHIPYSGPTLWNPRFQRRSPDKFLTLTPLRADRKPAHSTLPVISITPRKGSREFSFLASPDCSNTNKNTASVHTNTHTTAEQYSVVSKLPGKPEIPLSLAGDVSKGLDLPVFQRQKKTSADRVSIFPSVFTVVKSPRQRERQYGNNDSLFKSRTKQQTRNINDVSLSEQVLTYKYKGTNRKNDQDGVSANVRGDLSHASNNFSLIDKNIQDKGTIFSRRQDAFYHRLAREPTVLIPPPVGFRYVFPKDVKESKSESVKAEDTARYKRNRLKERRSYIRWNVHMRNSRKGNGYDSSMRQCSNDCNGNDESKNTNSGLHDKQSENRLHPTSRTVKSVPRENNPSRQLRRETSSASCCAIAAQFCDVLGQKTCQRCREFYAKNYDGPPREKVAAQGRVRASSPGVVTRESSWVEPLVGLQKVVIRVRDRQGRLEIAAEELNNQLL